MSNLCFSLPPYCLLQEKLTPGYTKLSGATVISQSRFYHKWNQRNTEIFLPGCKQRYNTCGPIAWHHTILIFTTFTRVQFSFWSRTIDSLQAWNGKVYLVIWYKLYGAIRCNTVQFLSKGQWTYGPIYEYHMSNQDILIHQTTKSLWQPCFWSHDLDFFYKPIVYGATHLLYSDALSDSVK